MSVQETFAPEIHLFFLWLSQDLWLHNCHGQFSKCSNPQALFICRLPEMVRGHLLQHSLVINLWKELNLSLQPLHEIMMAFIRSSLKHWYLWFSIDTAGKAHQLYDPPLPSCGYNPHLTSCAYSLTCFLISLFFAKLDYLHHQTASMLHWINVFELKMYNYSIHSVRYSFYLTVSRPPPPPLSSCHQTITLVLHPYSSLLPPPSKMLVLPHMKPKVSSRGDSEL